MGGKPGSAYYYVGIEHDSAFVFYVCMYVYVCMCMCMCVCVCVCRPFPMPLDASLVLSFKHSAPLYPQCSRCLLCNLLCLLQGTAFFTWTHTQPRRGWTWRARTQRMWDTRIHTHAHALSNARSTHTHTHTHTHKLNCLSLFDALMSRHADMSHR